MNINSAHIAGILIFGLVSTSAFSEVSCDIAGPQSPRDISLSEGLNAVKFDTAPNYTEMNLCNIHIHKEAEHKGPGFSIKSRNISGGYMCNNTASLTESELKDNFKGQGSFKDIKPGDTIEVHWVHSTCDVTPGPGLASCVSEKCENPQFRVETQVFLLVNNNEASNFNDFIESREKINSFHQAKLIPNTSGNPVVFLGSTTGPKYTDKLCSSFQVTWSVRPQCEKLNISSLHEWAKNGNVFNENKPHGVRALVTSPALLSPIN